MELRVVVQQLRWNDRANDVLFDLLAQLLVGHVLVVLGRDHYSVDARRLADLGILHCHLALAVRPQVGHQPAFADLAQLLAQPVRQRNRQRHQFRRLVGRVTEHHPLVARAVAVNSQRDVWRLLVDGRNHRASPRIEAVRRVRVPDLLHGRPHQILKVHIGFRRDLARNHHQAGAEQRLARHPTHGVLLQAGIENRIGDLIGDLIRMALGY